MLILNLYAAYLADPTMYVTYQRSNNAYKSKTRYSGQRIGSRSLKSSAENLEIMGYIESHTGFFDRNRRRGFRTRIKGTSKLHHIFDRHGFAPHMLEHHRDELIILKDKHKVPIEYEDTARTYVMRLFLEGINQSFNQARIALEIPDVEMETLKKKLRIHPSKSPVDFTRKRLRRIFNNSSFEEGGRFYHGWWQEIPSEYRKHITINEKPTVELDYSALILRMLYAREGRTPPTGGDPYTISSLNRALAKDAFIILLNADSETKAYKAFRRDHPDIDKATWNKAVEEIKSKHTPIEKHFASGVGLKLQEYDSRMAEIILDIINQEGMVALPIHDSFIVRSSFEEELKDAMEFAASLVLPGFETELKTDPPATWGTGLVTDDLYDLLADRTRHSQYHFQEESQRKRADNCHPNPTVWLRTKWSMESDEQGYIASLGLIEGQRDAGTQVIDYLRNSSASAVSVSTLISHLDIPYGGDALATILRYAYENVFDWSVETSILNRWNIGQVAHPNDLFIRVSQQSQIN
jgi:hypothetical protein